MESFVEFLYFPFVEAYRSFKEQEWMAVFMFLMLSILFIVVFILAVSFLYVLIRPAFISTTFSNEITKKTQVLAVTHKDAYSTTSLVPMLVGKATVLIPQTVYYPERFLVELSIEGYSAQTFDNQSLFNSVKSGDEVLVTFKEKYEQWIFSSEKKLGSLELIEVEKNKTKTSL